MDSLNRYLKVTILFGFGVFFLIKLVDGSLYYYINKRFAWLTVIGAISFLLLAIAVWRNQSGEHAHHDHDEEHDHSHDARLGPLLIVSIPLLLGLFVAPKPLDTSIIENKGISYAAPLVSQDSQAVQLNQPADNRTILDWIRAYNYSENPAEFRGEEASVIGFVYHDARLSENQFMVGRIAVVCCVADAFAVGMVVEWPEAAQMNDNAWVHVEGPVDVIEIDGWTLPLIVADEVNPTDEPPEPYVYP